MLNKAVIDLSHWDTVTDLGAAKRDGVVGVIHKATESIDYHDPTYDNHHSAALAAGLLWGAYHFLRPGNMLVQARYFVEYTGIHTDMIYAADHEDSAVSINDLKIFLKEVERLTSKIPILYSGHVIKEQIHDPDPDLSHYPLWLAQYTSGTPSWPQQTWPQWWLWQYTETGRVAGISGNCDINKYDGTADQLRIDWLGAGTQPQPQPEATVTIDITTPAGVAMKVKVNGTEIS